MSVTVIIITLTIFSVKENHPVTEERSFLRLENDIYVCVYIHICVYIDTHGYMCMHVCMVCIDIYACIY